MCEYCGCQSLESIRILTEEHDQVVDLISVARSAHRQGDENTLIEKCRAILAVLGPHTHIEEAGLFPAMARDFPEQIAALVSDHRHIEAVLARALDGTAAGDPQWPAQVEAVFALLRDHILREQNGVFPAALSTLTTDEWEALDELRLASASEA